MKLFRTVSVGGISKDELFMKLSAAQVSLNSIAHTLILSPAFQISTRDMRIRLIKISPLELGLTSRCKYIEIVRQATKFDLETCDLQIAPFLRLSFDDQTEGPFVTVASNIIPSAELNPSGFYLRNRDGILGLYGYRVVEDFLWPRKSEFIFKSAG